MTEGQLVTNMQLAASIKHRGRRSASSLVRVLSLLYSTEEEGVKIMEFLNSYSWTPHEVWFDKVECAIHGYGDAVSRVLMVAWLNGAWRTSEISKSQPVYTSIFLTHVWKLSHDSWNIKSKQFSSAVGSWRNKQSYSTGKMAQNSCSSSPTSLQESCVRG